MKKTPTAINCLILLALFCITLSVSIFEVTAQEKSQKGINDDVLIEKAEGWTLSKSSSGSTVFEGRLIDGAVEAIISYFKGVGVANKSLTLSSGGGVTLPSIRLGRFIHDHNIPIHINNICASTCAYFILPAAPDVSFSEHAIIGLHHAPTEKYLKRLEMVLTSEKFKNNSATTDKQGEKLARLIERARKELRTSNDFYSELGLPEDALLSVTNLDIVAKRFLAKHNVPAKIRNKVLIVPDQTFLKHCLGFNIPAWKGVSEQHVKMLSNKNKYPILALSEGNFIYKNKLIKESDAQNCFLSKL